MNKSCLLQSTQAMAETSDNIQAELKNKPGRRMKGIRATCSASALGRESWSRNFSYRDRVSAQLNEC